MFEVGERLLHGHIKDLGDGLPLVFHLERLAVVPPAPALFAFDVDIREEVHLDLDQPVPLAGLATASLQVEREPSRLVTTDLRLLGPGERLPDLVKDLGVGGRVAPRGLSDRALVDHDHLVDLGIELDRFELPGSDPGMVEILLERLIKGIIDEGRFAASGHPGDDREDAEGDPDIDVLEVVLLAAGNYEVPGILSSFVRDIYLQSSRQVLSREGLTAPLDLCGGSFRYHVPAVEAGARPHVHNIIGAPYGILVMFDHDERVPEVAEPPEGVDQLLVVFLVEADRGLIEHVQHSHQVGPDLGCQADPLGLTARKGAGIPREGEVAEPDLLEEVQP
ncbi:MAG: hypothetical protein BWY93_00638 [Euryarchaeota archaeon ADurb.BinA087]|nr:MAG: hypothetical protein BWY93_00638 [Euryarchaeota archaeon ADurb.BinA087]